MAPRAECPSGTTSLRDRRARHRPGPLARRQAPPSGCCRGPGWNPQSDTPSKEHPEAVAWCRLISADQHVPAPALSSFTGTRPTRIDSSKSRAAMPRTRASSVRAFVAYSGGTMTTAPSPPNRNGIRIGAQRFRSAAMPVAATKLTVLCRPLAMAPVESTMSVTATSQSSGPFVPPGQRCRDWSRATAGPRRSRTRPLCARRQVSFERKRRHHPAQGMWKPAGRIFDQVQAELDRHTVRTLMRRVLARPA